MELSASRSSTRGSSNQLTTASKAALQKACPLLTLLIQARMDVKEVGNTALRTVSSNQLLPVSAGKMPISTSFLSSAQAELFNSHQLEEVEVVRLRAPESAEAEVTSEEHFTRPDHHRKTNQSYIRTIALATKMQLILFPLTRKTRLSTIHSSWTQSTHWDTMENTKKKRESANSVAALDRQLSLAVESSKAICGSVVTSVQVGFMRCACVTNLEIWAFWTIF